MRVRLASEGPLLLSGTLVSIIIAMSYGNNLVYIFAFTWLAFCLVALVVGIAILRSIKVLRIDVESGFVGERQNVRVSVINKSESASAYIDWAKAEKSRVRGVITSLEASSQGVLEAFYLPESRGRYKLDSILLSTTFPASVFRISQVIDREEYYYAYPRAIGERPFPTPSSGLRGEGELGLGRGDDFVGHRVHQLGESERHVDWKLFARKGLKQVKEFVGGSEAHVILRETDLMDIPFEARLAQLAKWVLEADKRGLSFGVNAAGRELEISRGLVHKRRALELLATSVEAA